MTPGAGQARLLAPQRLPYPANPAEIAGRGGVAALRAGGQFHALLGLAPGEDGPPARQKALVEIQFAAGHGRFQALQQALEHGEAGAGAVGAGRVMVLNAH